MTQLTAAPASGFGAAQDGAQNTPEPVDWLPMKTSLPACPPSAETGGIYVPAIGFDRLFRGDRTSLKAEHEKLQRRVKLVHVVAESARSLIRSFRIAPNDAGRGLRR